MKTITTLEQPSHSVSTRRILAKNGFDCALVTLQPGDAIEVEAARASEEHLLFVVQGEAKVRSGEITTLLSAEEAFLLPTKEGCTVTASGAQPAKLLRVDVPPRQVVEPPIYAFETAK